ncbi:DUF3152 domain-containing protein [Streptomyces sp. NBC_01102]|uniref:DUF3152 domain-containing protein n=1 Tax=unclassified Streptomyces TaxID=2593676 RepID=UPI003866F892|nr:DUF3152 domain-containing protein [Streptomyces sp. NBC_01102]
MHTDHAHRIRTAAATRRPAGRAAPAPPRSPGRRQSRQQDRQRTRVRRRRRQRRSMLLLVTLAGAVAAVFLSFDPPWQRDTGPASAADRDASPSPAPPSPTTAPEAPAPPEAAASPSVKPSAAPSVPASGPGTFTVARQGVTPTGKGHAYRVEVEDGSGVDPDRAARDVADVLADPRGWSKGKARSFRQVADGSAGLVIRIGTPGTTDRLCGGYGLNTRGELNCRGSENVMVNLRRWQLGSPQFDGSLADYRALIVNHEVGHWLGHGHETCPGPGRPAPAMMQQIKGLKGCVSNAWPYTTGGEYLGGPSVP